MKKINFFTVGLIACLLTLTWHLYATQPLRTSGLALVGTVELRTTQRDALAKTQTEFRQRSENELKRTNILLQSLTQEITFTKSKLSSASPQELEILNKKIAILYDRKQNLRDYQEQWAIILRLIATHQTLVEDIITYLSSPQPTLKPIYPWKEVYDTSLRQAEAETKIEYDLKKRDSIINQRTAATDMLTWLEKQIDKKNKEHAGLTAKLEQAIQEPSLKEQSDIVTHELNALKEKVTSTLLRIEKLDREIKWRNDIIDLEHNRFDDQKSLLSRMEKRLILEQRDIAQARLEKQEEDRTSLTIKEEINQEKEAKKQRRDARIQEAESLLKIITACKDKKIKDARYILTKMRYRLIAASILTTDKELQLLEAKKEFADGRAQEKGLQLSMAEIYYKLRNKLEKVDNLLNEFINKRELSFNARATLQDKLHIAQITSTEINRALERLKKLRIKVRHHRPDTFKGKDNEYHFLLKLLDRIKRKLYQGLGYTQALLALQADLIAQQTKIIHHYDLIIKNLERRRVYSVWQRSPDAISLAMLSRAALEAETFFTKLYWETPQYLGPRALITALRSLSGYTWLLILIYLLLYLGSIILFKRGLIMLERILNHHAVTSGTLFLPIIRALVNFAHKHFTLLYTWLFLAPIVPRIGSYTHALFYLIAIPIWVYLARCFTHTFKELNRHMSYVFFAESFQEKFIHLITILCYATAIIIPLRIALLSYTDAASSDFATVLLAAYSLTMLVVFALFFTKADVLKLIPTSYSVSIRLKRTIDRYYYPVFLFSMAMLILSNRYVGYPTLAWFLIFAVPATIFVLYILFAAHAYIRKHAIFLFMREESDEVVDKFEHAKAFYTFFIIFSFLLMFFVAFGVFTRIWGLSYSPSDLWRLFAEKWVITIDVDTHIGIIQFMELGLFIASGLVVSSLLHKSIFKRLFDILHTDPGAQNTISRITHYLIIFLAIILGLSFIQLKQLIFWVGAPLTIGLGLALKDVAFDFIGGILVLIERPIEIGNYVQIDHIKGTVHKISARSTTLITSHNHSVIIPNKDLITKWMVNWGHSRYAVGFELTIHVDLESDPEKVKKLLLDIINAHPLVLKVPATIVRLDNIEDGSLCFMARAFVSARRIKEHADVAAYIRCELLKVFKTHHIMLAKQTRVIEFAQASKTIDIKFDQ
ncbi:MAG: mechanosensitive ion channel domain-containing protein [Candidatus Babeliales bacterium]